MVQNLKLSECEDRWDTIVRNVNGASQANKRSGSLEYSPCRAKGILAWDTHECLWGIPNRELFDMVNGALEISRSAEG